MSEIASPYIPQKNPLRIPTCACVYTCMCMYILSCTFLNLYYVFLYKFICMTPPPTTSHFLSVSLHTHAYAHIHIHNTICLYVVIASSHSFPSLSSYTHTSIAYQIEFRIYGARVFVHTYTRTHTQTHTHSNTLTHIITHMHARAHTHIHRPIRAIVVRHDSCMCTYESWHAHVTHMSHTCPTYIT